MRTPLTPLLISLLAGCAPKMVGYNPEEVANDMKGRAIVIRNGCLEKTTVVGLDKDFQMAFPGLRKQDSSFQSQIHRTFWGGMMPSLRTQRIELDSHCLPGSDSTRIEDPTTGWTMFLDTTRLEPSKIYMARSAIRYVDSSKTTFKEHSTSFGSGNSVYDAGPTVETKKALGAAMAFGLYDPTKRRFVFSQKLDTKSSTIPLALKLSPQTDWTNNARSLGASTGRAIQGILDLK